MLTGLPPPMWLYGLTYEGQVSGAPGVPAVVKPAMGPGSFRG